MMRDIIMCYSSAKLMVALCLITSFCVTCMASYGAHKCTSWCGDHSISFPFRLKDSPKICGNKWRFLELSCEKNQLFVYLKSMRYKVLSIDYDYQTIRLREVSIEELDSSSLPHYSLTRYNFSEFYPYYFSSSKFYWVHNNIMIYVRCEHPMDSPGFIDTAPCFNASYSYFYVGSGHMEDVKLEDGCVIEMMYITSWPLQQNNSLSCTDIHAMLFYGFQLGWFSQLLFHSIPWTLLMFTTWIFQLLVLHAGAKFVFGTPFVIALLIYKWRRRHLSMYENIEDFLQSDSNNIIPIRYSYRDIKNMTKGFKIRLGKGGYGSVFKGQLRSGRDVAVKLLDKAEANGQDFINEVATLGRVHHVNVVHLIGYCVERSKRALIYEFMQNGSLDKYILSKNVAREQSLDLHQLYTISLGVARGIEYLHKGCDMQILHFDIKPHNILLDDNFIPKVSDFGLAKLYPTNDSIVSLTAARGTIGYMAPELFYKNVGGVSYKADVYSFGMLLMEMAGRRKNLNVFAEKSSQFYFPFWAYDQINEGNEISIANATEEEIKVARKMVIVALWCIQTKPSDRPPMNKVVEMLEGDEKDLELPQKPYLYPQDLPEVDDDNDNDSCSTHQSKSRSPLSKNKAVEMLVAEEKGLVLPQKPFQITQDSPTVDVSVHSYSTPSSSYPTMKHSKETSTLLTEQDERST